MAFLDTNAFYYAADLSTNNEIDVESLQSYIIGNNIAISSVSFYEFLVNFSSSIECIHKGSRYLNENNIRVVYNKYFPAEDKLKQDFTNITKEQLKSVLNVIIEQKIDVESRFALIIYSLILFSAFMFYYIPEGNDASDLNKYVFRVAYETWMQNGLSWFQEIFREGYESDNCEKLVRDDVELLLEDALSVTFPLFDAAADITTEQEFIDLINKFDFIKSASNAISKIHKSATPMVYLSKLAKIYSGGFKNLKWDEYKKDLFNPVNSEIPEKALSEYIEEIVDKCCRNGSPFLKNDILDAIILCNIDEDYKIISFDKGMIAHMQKYSSERQTYQDSLDLISKFVDSIYMSN